MNPLRIFARLRAQDAALKLLAAEVDRRIAEATGALEAHSGKSIACGRCSALMDIAVDRENGPSIVTDGKQRAVVCAWCRAALKPRGWKPIKPTLPEPPAEAPKEQEATS